MYPKKQKIQEPSFPKLKYIGYTYVMIKFREKHTNINFCSD